MLFLVLTGFLSFAERQLKFNNWKFMYMTDTSHMGSNSPGEKFVYSKLVRSCHCFIQNRLKSVSCGPPHVHLIPI
jgi:hypothetical protein